MRGVKRRFTHTRAVSCVCTVYVSFFLTLTTPTDGSRHSPETLTATPLARTRCVPAPAGGARSPSRPPHGSGPVSVIVTHMPPVPDAFPARALPRSGSNRCVLRQPSTWRVASGSILAISCDLDRLLVARARPSLARRPRRVPRVTLRPPSRRPSPRRAQAAAPARLTCAASRRRWRRCPARSCP